MTIREYLKSLGASDQELGAKVVTRMEQAMLIDADLSQFQPDTVLKFIESASSALCKNYDTINAKILQADAQTDCLSRHIKEAQTAIDDLRAQTAGIKEAKINSPETRDAVMAYATVLNATKEIFGVDIVPDVMVAAINAGSYIAWRGIMGPKDKDDVNGAKSVKYRF